MTNYLLIVGSLFGFFFAIPNNLFAFVTLKRRQCLRTGIGQYLLYMSVINQINLGLLTARLIHMAVDITAVGASATWDDLLCKVLHYLLTSASRITYWLSSLIAIERVYMTVFLNGRWLKKPHIARRLIFVSIAGILITDAYEAAFIKSFSDVHGDHEVMCVSAFPVSHRSMWMRVHLLVSILNSLLPFLINLCCTVTIIIIVLKKKMNTRAANTCKC